MDSKKLKNTVRIGIITKIEMKREDIYQKFILIIYIPPYKYGKYLCPHFKKKRGHPEENQKSNTFRICGTSLVLISEIFLSFILLSIFLHSK